MTFLTYAHHSNVAIIVLPKGWYRHPKHAGMSAGVPKHVVVNLRQLAAFKESEEISLDLLKQKNILNVSGKEAKLPLKVRQGTERYF